MGNITGIRNLDTDKLYCILRRQLLLMVSLFVLAFGVALCVRSDMGSSVISSAPYAFYLAGMEGKVPDWSLGMYTNLLNILLVCSQIAVLRRRYRPVQLLQLLVGVLFGVFIDTSMAITSGLFPESVVYKAIIMAVGATLMALGVAMEMRCASVTMPGEGLPAALSRVTGKPFANMKILVDTGLVMLAVGACYLFFGAWMWNVVGPGTLFAMLYIGLAVKLISRRLGWFDRLLG